MTAQDRAPLVFTKTHGGQIGTAIMTPIGTTDIEFRLKLNGVEIETERDVAEYDTEAERDGALPGLVDLYESNGYDRVTS